MQHIGKCPQLFHRDPFRGQSFTFARYCPTPPPQTELVILSVISIFYIAMLTGVAVSYCNTLIKLRQKDTMARFMDDLEHLEELDRDELADLSRRVREYRRRQR